MRKLITALLSIFTFSSAASSFVVHTYVEDKIYGQKNNFADEDLQIGKFSDGKSTNDTKEYKTLKRNEDDHHEFCIETCRRFIHAEDAAFDINHHLKITIRNMPLLPNTFLINKF